MDFNERSRLYDLLLESSEIGVVSGSSKTDFYVYEWFIVETGEIFYIGKGRGNRYKAYHKRALEAEKIRSLYKTDVRFVGKNLTEEEAVRMESAEILRILNSTTNILTNRLVPLSSARHGYDRSLNTPALCFEKTPVLWVSAIDEHYYGLKSRRFDKVEVGNLKSVYFIDKKILPFIHETLYCNNLISYYDEVISWLSTIGSSVVKTKYAKSVTAWVYIGDDDVHNYYIDQQLAVERLGRNIPVYHLLDLWRFAKKMF